MKITKTAQREVIKDIRKQLKIATKTGLTNTLTNYPQRLSAYIPRQWSNHDRRN